MEWGCMRALIDYDGWRKWKDFAHDPADEGEAAAKKAASKPKKSRTARPAGSSAG